LNVIFVVAADLDWTPGKKEVILGINTKIACERAVALALDHLQKEAPAMIVATAGDAGAKWNRVMMCSLMRDYMFSLSNKVKIATYHYADEFTTWGEMKALAHHVRRHFAFTQVTSVILSVKWWHALRAWVLCRYWLKQENCSHIPVGVSPCPSKVGWFTLAKELFGAWPKNIRRMRRGY
jgi:hypothetical protein